MNSGQGVRILIMAGGTGGHVMPALAVAEQLRTQGVEVSWLGTRRGLESRLVPRAGFPIDYISIGGLRGKGWVGWLLAPFRLTLALVQAGGVLVRRRPAAVLGMGGFVTGPGGVMSWLLRRPLLVHEQNAIAGLTNRLLAPLACRVMVAFPATRLGRGACITGNPLRTEITALEVPQTRYTSRSGRLRVLVIGGSLGARALNAVMPVALATLPDGVRPEVWHQAGNRLLEEARAGYTRAGLDARVEPFIDDMAAAYAWADLVVCRAGALTVSELAGAGVAALLVPYPYAVDDHQSANARYLSEADAAFLIPQRDLDVAALQRLLTELAGEQGRSRLAQMAMAARRLAYPEATREVARHCLEVARV